MATVDILEYLNFPIIFEENQTCCSQPAFNSGDRAAALMVARHVLNLFDKAHVVVVPSGSCAAMVRWGYPQLFRNDPDLPRALTLARKTWELTEFLLFVTKSLPWPGTYPRRVAFHRSCHMRELLPDSGPEKLLGSIQGLEIIPLQNAEQCCGFGGAFAVSFPWTSQRIGLSKLEELTREKPEEIIVSDMGCCMHLQGLDQKNHASNHALPFKHYAQVLRDSLTTQSAAVTHLT